MENKSFRNLVESLHRLDESDDYYKKPDQPKAPGAQVKGKQKAPKDKPGKKSAFQDQLVGEESEGEYGFLSKYVSEDELEEDLVTQMKREMGDYIKGRKSVEEEEAEKPKQFNRGIKGQQRDVQKKKGVKTVTDPDGPLFDDINEGSALTREDVIGIWKKVFPNSTALSGKTFGGGDSFKFKLAKDKTEVANGIWENDPLSYSAFLEEDGSWKEHSLNLHVAPPEGSHLAYGSESMRKKSTKKPVTAAMLEKRFEQVKEFVTANAGNLKNPSFDISSKIGGVEEGMNASQHRDAMMKKMKKNAPNAFKKSNKEEPKKEKTTEDDDPCWDDYEQVGMKKKNGKKVPNCVPESEEEADAQLDNPQDSMGSQTPTAQEIADKHGVDITEIVRELVKGRKIEKEHTDDAQQADEIARDHLAELPDYYTRLGKMEQKPTQEGFGDKIKKAVGWDETDDEAQDREHDDRAYKKRRSKKVTRRDMDPSELGEAQKLKDIIEHAQKLLDKLD